MKIRLHNFKDRQYKRQPYIIETYFNSKAYILYIYPFTVDYIKTFTGFDRFLSLPGFKLSYKEYKGYQDDGRYEWSEWDNLVEDEPF
jgi:hypothetical protein